MANTSGGTWSRSSHTCSARGMGDDAGGGSVLVAEALRRRSAQQRARWEAFQRREEEARAALETPPPRARWAPPPAAASSLDGIRRRRVAAGSPENASAAATRADPPDPARASPRRPPSRSRSPSPSSRPAAPPPAECRICFSGADAGRLFSPCLCRGTMRHVHVACLDRWRVASARRGNASWRRCDQCGFEYVLRRGRWAAALESPRLPALASFAALAAAVLVAGVAARVTAVTLVTPFLRRVARACRRAPERYGPRSFVAALVPGGDVVDAIDRLGAPRPSHAWRRRVREAVDATVDATRGGGFESSSDATKEPSSASARARLAARLALLRRSATLRGVAASTASASPLHVEFFAYAFLNWTPPWWDARDAPAWWLRSDRLADVADALVAGVACVGAVGFAMHVAQRLRMDFRGDAERVLFPLAAMFATHGRRAARVVVAGGVFWALKKTHERCAAACKSALARYGERVVARDVEVEEPE